MAAPKRRASAVPAEERFRLLVETVRDYAIYLIEPDGTVATWNAGAEKLKGWTTAEIVGKSFAAFFPPEDAAKPARMMAAAERDGRVEDEGWRVRKDGTRFWANSVLTALRDEEGRLVGFAKVTRDLTERRQADQRLQQVLDDLKRSNQELDQFAAFASHDLQEPLRKMASFAGLLAAHYKDKVDDEGRSWIAKIVDGADRMRALIADLLDYSRIGRIEEPTEVVNLGDAARAALRDLDVAVKETGAEVSVGRLPSVPGRRPRLERALLNLISNAIKYRDPERPLKVRIRAVRDGAGWDLAVSDNGIGFDPEHAERIFEPFRRLHPKHKYPGSGLGLSAVAKIAQLHGGRAWAVSKPGEGSVFHLWLPAGH